jgi:ferredoxin-nitrite reductase
MYLASYLEERLELDQPINIHLTGCHHSCAQHYIGDIGLLATKVEVGEEMVEGYHLHVGGGWADQQGIARELRAAVPFEELPPLVERLVAAYLELRTSREESFADFVRQRELPELQEYLAAPAADAISA